MPGVTLPIPAELEAVGAPLGTAPFDVTGHPAMSVPCGLSDGLPAGMMLIDRPGLREDGDRPRGVRVREGGPPDGRAP